MNVLCAIMRAWIRGVPGTGGVRIGASDAARRGLRGARGGRGGFRRSVMDISFMMGENEGSEVNDGEAKKV